MNRKQRRAQNAVAATKARVQYERTRPTSAPTNEAPSGLASEVKLIEMAPPEHLMHMVNAANSYLRVYRYGPCSVIVTKEFGRYHLSISHRSRYPTWVEISGAWYKAIPGAETLTGVLILPPLANYVNYDNFCMQVMEAPPQENWDGLFDRHEPGDDHGRPEPEAELVP